MIIRIPKIYVEYFLNILEKKGTKIYIDPNVSVAANGGLSEYFTKKPTKNSYGKIHFLIGLLKKKENLQYKFGFRIHIYSLF